jgi:hypothetical protein
MESGPPSCSCDGGEVSRESNFNHSASHTHGNESMAVLSVLS